MIKGLPTDEETAKWFEENIGIRNDCSASGAIYTFASGIVLDMPAEASAYDYEIVQAQLKVLMMSR